MSSPKLPTWGCGLAGRCDGRTGRRLHFAVAGWSGPHSSTAMCLRCWWRLRAWRRPATTTTPPIRLSPSTTTAPSASTQPAALAARPRR